MDYWPIYLILGILAAVIIGGFVFIFVIIRKQNTAALSHQDYAEIGKLQAKMDNLETTMPGIVQKTIGESQLDYLRQQMEVQRKLAEEISKNFKEITANVNESITAGFKSTQDTVAEVNKQLGSIGKTQETLASVSGEVNSLRRVLEGNQTRGRFGEITLETIVRSVFGDEVKDIYAFQKDIKTEDGTVTPDATIYLPEPDKRLCIDSKFPLASYRDLLDDVNQKDLLKKFGTEMRLHIAKIKSSYIIHNETAPYALMFIPSDGVFAYLHSSMFDIVEAAYRDNVIIVSPSTLQPILTTVNMLRMDRKRAENIQQLNIKIEKLRSEFTKFSEAWLRASRSIRQTLGTFDAIDTRTRVLIRTFDSITASEDEIAEVANIDIDDNMQ